MISLLQSTFATLASVTHMDKAQQVASDLFQSAISLGNRVIAALIIFIIGRFLISLINKLVAKILAKRNVEPSVQSFLKSFVKIMLMVLLAIAIIGKLGVETTSLAALLASAGVAVGMALSGNLQNFAGGLIVLFLRPYKVGDLIESQSVLGIVKEIQIFHTILTTPDNKVIYVPNGALSSGTIINYSKENTRRVEWTVGVEYGEDYEKVKETVLKLIQADERILSTPEPMVVLKDLADSSVDVMFRVWVKSEDYWNVYFDMNKTVYATFNKENIGFPFPQLTIHQSND